MQWFQKIIHSYNRWFVSPNEKPQTETWHRARMISVLCISVIIALTGFYMLRHYFDYDHPARIPHLMIGVSAIIAIMYAMLSNYRQRYDIAVLTIIGIGSSLVCIATWFNQHTADVIPLYYFIPMLIFSTLILSSGRTLVLIIAHITVMIILGVMTDNIFGVLEGPGIFYVFTGFGVLILTDYRAKREQLRIETLEASEIRYRMISEMISDYAFAYHIDEDRKLRVDWITESVQTVTGYTPEELNAAWQLPILFDEHDRDRIRQHVNEAIEGTTAQHEYELMTKDGERRIVRINQRPIWDDKYQRVVRIYGVAQDITLEKIAEKEKSHLAMERGRLNLINDFVSAISHDFRTRLANIETSRYLIKRKIGKEMAEKVQQNLDLIQKDVRYLTEQLVNLNLISHLMELKPELCDINNMISDILDTETHRAARKNIVLRFEPDNNIPAIMLDKQEIHRAIGYILTNAINYTDAGGKVLLQTTCDDKMLNIHVIDTGQGIESQYLSQIFDLFYRIDPARSLQTGGVGLGLSLAKMIVEAHQGNITVESEIGQGSTFTMSLPIKSL